MQVSRAEADQYFNLLWHLQWFVSEEQGILPSVDSVEEYIALDGKVSVGDALWEHPEWITDYVERNPHALSSDELDIIDGWTDLIAGDFYVFRYLKKHTIFIRNEDVYGVLGLYDAIEDLLYPHKPPILVRTVLLPFKGRIIYDAVMRRHNIIFGSGIRSNLKERYMTAKQNRRIIVQLDADRPKTAPKPREPKQDWGPQIQEIVQATEKMRGGPVLQSAAFGLLRASANMAQAAWETSEDHKALWDNERQVRRALSRLQTVLERME